MQHPEPVGDIDARLMKTISGVHRLRWIALIVLGVVLASAIAVMGLVISDQQTQLRSDCALWRSIGTLPVQILPGATKPTLFNVTIIAESRAAYIGQGCGKIPPNPAEKLWADYFHIPAE